MKILGKVVGWLLGIGILVGVGLYLVGSCGPKTPPDGGDLWLTEYEAYEDQTAHTGMDGGAFVVPGLRIRDPRDINAKEDGYTPAKYALTNGQFEQLESGETVYRRLADGVLRRSTWIWDDGKILLMDESGCLAHETYAFDGFYAGPDACWDESVTRLMEATLPATGRKYREAVNPSGTHVQFSVSEDGVYTLRRTIPSAKFIEDYRLDPFGRGVYALEKEGDPEVRAQLAVLPDGATVIFSQAGQTDKYILE